MDRRDYGERQSVDRAHNYTYAYLGMGAVASAEEDHRTAAELLRKAVQLDPAFFPARAALANALLAANEPKETIALLEDHLRRDPRSQGYFLLGQAHFQLQQFEKARENYETAIKKYPQYGEAYYRLSTVYARLGQPARAKECIQKSRELNAQYRQDDRAKRSRYDDLNAVRGRVAETYNAAARLCYTQKKVREAERLWRRASALAPNDAESRQGLAWLCRQQVRIPETVAALEELAAIQPNDAEVWLEIGRLHADVAQYAEAETALARAVERAPKEPRFKAAYDAARKMREAKK